MKSTLKIDLDRVNECAKRLYKLHWASSRRTVLICGRVKAVKAGPVGGSGRKVLKVLDTLGTCPQGIGDFKVIASLQSPCHHLNERCQQVLWEHLQRQIKARCQTKSQISRHFYACLCLVGL